MKEAIHVLLDEEALKKTQIFMSDKDKEIRGTADSEFILKESQHGPEYSRRLRKWRKEQ